MQTLQRSAQQAKQTWWLVKTVSNYLAVDTGWIFETSRVWLMMEKERSSFHTVILYFCLWQVEERDQLLVVSTEPISSGLSSNDTVFQKITPVAINSQINSYRKHRVGRTI